MPTDEAGQYGCAAGQAHLDLFPPHSQPNASPVPKSRRGFRWPREARDLVRSQIDASGGALSALLSALEELSGNPRWACRRFVRSMGVRAKRSQRAWTTAERQRLLKLLDLHPVVEIARLLRRSQSSVRHMLQRIGANARMGTDSFTAYTLAVALHVRPEKVREWIERGWLEARAVETLAGKRTIIAAEDFCEFCRRHTREAIGNRLARERLEFVYRFAFPPTHAELLPVRASKKERGAYLKQARQGFPPARAESKVEPADMDGEEEERWA